MVLNGTLHEFILADILQLLSQQKATGKLVLTSDRREGFLALHEGAIVAAEDDAESLQSKLVNCLLTVKRLPESHVNGLLVASGADAYRSAAELVSRQHLSAAELVAFAQTVIEDFVCSLFTWRTGEYRFESRSSVGEHIIPGVTLSCDYIVMEAMRRTDETKQIRSRISDDTIFVQAGQHTYTYTSDVVTLLASPEYYALYFVDGLSTVQTLAQRTCITRYRLYEVLHTLWQHDLIAPLSSKLSRSIQAALTRKKGEITPQRGAAVVAVGLTMSAVAATFCIGLLTGGFLGTPPGTNAGRVNAVALAEEQAALKSRAAILQYRGWTGRQPKSLVEIVQAGYIGPTDAAAVPISLLTD